MRESFVIHSEYIEDLPEANKKEYLWYCYNYGINSIEPVLDGFEQTVWIKIKRRIDADIGSYETQKENNKIWKAKNHYKNNRASEEELKLLESIGFLGSPKNSLPYTNTNTHSVNVSVSDNVSVSEFDNDNVSVHDTDTVSVFDENRVCEKQQFFLKLWNDNADVLGIAATIEKPQDFKKAFTYPTVTKEYIQNGMDNFIQAIKTGKLDKRFIPSTPDRFILKNTLERFQVPYSNEKKSTIYDADHRGAFPEQVRL